MKLEEVLFVLLDEYADWEAASLAAAINDGPDQTEQKYCVKTVSLTLEPVRSIGGFRTVPDYGIDDVGNDFAGIILIGGNSWRKEESQAVMKLVEKALAANKPIGAICDATVFLGKNGVLNRGKHTSNHITDLQESAGANYTGVADYLEQQAVREGNLITANGSAYLEFGREVMTVLEAAPQQEIDEWYEFFKHGYYEFVEKNK